MAIDKIDLPDWAGDDWVAIEGDSEALIIQAIKKINEIIDEVNK